MVLYSPDWTDKGFSFILLAVNLFRHPTLIVQGLYCNFWPMSIVCACKRQVIDTIIACVVLSLLFH